MSDLVPMDASLSPLHAQIVFHENGWYLADLGSAHGTHRLVADAGKAVAVGDVFRIARTELQVLAVPDRNE